MVNGQKAHHYALNCPYGKFPISPGRIASYPFNKSHRKLRTACLAGMSHRNLVENKPVNPFHSCSHPSLGKSILYCRHDNIMAFHIRICITYSKRSLVIHLAASPKCEGDSNTVNLKLCRCISVMTTKGLV